MSNPVIAIMGNKNLTGGVYDVLASFHHGLLQGFLQNNARAYYAADCVEQKINFNLLVTFNCGGANALQQVMDAGICSVMWTVDSLFGPNYNLIKHFSNNPKFLLFEVTPADMNITSKFMPNLIHLPIAHGTNELFWKKQNVEKEFDITLFSSIKDYEEIRNSAMSQMSADEKKTYLDLYEICKNNTECNYHELCAAYQKENNIDFDENTYIKMYNNIVYPLEYEQKIKLLQSLKDFNVKVFGNDLWTKYISGKQEYMGASNIKDAVNYMNKSKITLHLQPMTLQGGLHERFLNASSVGTFVLSNNNQTICRFFGDNFGYYNDITYDNVADIADYYLQNSDIREEKINIAREIVLKNHTWKNRAAEILKYFQA